MCGSIIQVMVIDRTETRLNTVGQLAALLEGTLAVDCRSLGNDGERDAFIGSVVARLGWHLHLLDEAVKGALDDVQKFVAVVKI